MNEVVNSLTIEDWVSKWQSGEPGHSKKTIVGVYSVLLRILMASSHFFVEKLPIHLHFGPKTLCSKNRK